MCQWGSNRNLWASYRMRPSPSPTYHKPRGGKSATTDWAHHVGSSSSLITIVVMTLFLLTECGLLLFNELTLRWCGSSLGSGLFCTWLQLKSLAYLCYPQEGSYEFIVPGRMYRLVGWQIHCGCMVQDTHIALLVSLWSHYDFLLS